MCGIYVSCDSLRHCPPGAELQLRLKRRGPDHFQTILRTLKENRGSETSDAEHFLTLSSTVLSLRGNAISEQPLVDELTGSCLCWNGEAWALAQESISGNDTEVVFDALCRCLTKIENTSSNLRDHKDLSLMGFVQTLRKIVGPYAYVFFDAIKSRIIFGGDVLGRRSLLYKQAQTPTFVLSSLSDPESPTNWNEIEANAVYVYDPFSEDGTRLTKLSSLETGTADQPHYPPASPLFLNRSIPSRPLDGLTKESIIIEQLATRLQNACQIRAAGIPVSQMPQHVGVPSLAVLFSGGVDCTLLARIVHDHIPSEQSIDLINVAFENPRTVRAAQHCGKTKSANLSPFALCPDRKTGLTSLIDLREACPGRIWRFVSVDIPYAEMMEHRETIKTLMWPHNTEMDFSIASALYFAARGKGWVFDDKQDCQVPYDTPARVLISGLGADEVFGGYTRHATAFERHGYSGLLEELQLDVQRLGRRNLGRDDRVTSHWGKEVRYPYLDENFLGWALNLPVWEKCGFGEPLNQSQTSVQSVPGGEEQQTILVQHTIEPAKKAIRLVALGMGLQRSAFERKRAIQFGARSAKMELGRIKGTQIIE